MVLYILSPSDIGIWASRLSLVSSLVLSVIFVSQFVSRFVSHFVSFLFTTVLIVFCLSRSPVTKKLTLFVVCTDL